MSKNIYITFGGRAYDATTEKIVSRAPRFGADEVRVYDDVWLTTTQNKFCDEQRWAFDHPHKRGFGWYIWKPYTILQALASAGPGDVVLFTDADTFPISHLDVLFETCRTDGGIMLFSAVGHNNRQWCKRDCFIVMDQDEPRYHDAPAGVARFMLFEKGKQMPQRFLEEWLGYTCDPRANTFDPSVLGPELDGFIEHRCEQAILTNLAHKHGVRLYREACQQGERYTYDKDLFPTLFHQEVTVAGKYLNKTAPVVGSRFRNTI